MSTLKRTLIAFTAFLVNYYGIVLVYKGVPTEELQVGLTFAMITFLTLLIVSAFQRDISYLFGGMALFYIPFIVMQAGLAWASFGAITTGIIMGLLIWGVPTLLTRNYGIASTISTFFGDLWARLRRKAILRRIRKMAGSTKGGDNLAHEGLLEFTSLERECLKIHSFFDGSDPMLEETLSEVLPQVGSLQKEHARLLLRSAHLDGYLENSPADSLRQEIQQLESGISQLEDKVTQGQMTKTLTLKKNRIADWEKMRVCKDRIKGQLLQVLETIRGTFDKLNSLKFTDIQTLEANSSSIQESLTYLQNDLAAMEEGLISAETLLES